MRLRFVTSIPDFIEGRVIDNVNPRSPQTLAWLRSGVAVAEPSLEEQTTLAPDTVERAVLRRGKVTGKRKTRASAVLAEDD